MADGALRRRLQVVPLKMLLRGGTLGAVAALGHPPFDLWLLTLLGFAAAFYQLMRVDAGRLAFVLGLGFGTGYFVLSLNWIVEPFFVDPWRHGWMAPFAITFLAAGLGLFFAVAFWSAKRLSVAGGAVVLTLTLAEVIRAYLFTGFPWAMPSYVLIDQGVAQGAAIVGPHGLNLLFFVVAWSLAWAVFSGERRDVWSVAALAMIAGLAVPVASPSPSISEERPVVRLIQPNAPQHQKWAPQYAGLFFERMVKFTRTGEERPDLIVWPETAVPVWLHNAANTLGIISGAAGDVPVVLGINRAEGRRIFNAAILMDSEGQVAETYDKHHLVPFGEYMPFEWLFRQIEVGGLAARAEGGYASGPGPRLLDFGALGTALPLICYEAVFAHDVGRAPARPAFLMQLTNDAWFGSRSGPQQHLAQARMRAIEQGLPMIRAANTGISAVIDPAGRITDSLPLNTAGYLDAILPASVAPTLYSRTGDVPWAFLVLLGMIWAVFRRSRQSLWLH